MRGETALTFRKTGLLCRKLMSSASQEISRHYHVHESKSFFLILGQYYSPVHVKVLQAVTFHQVSNQNSVRSYLPSHACHMHCLSYTTLLLTYLLTYLLYLSGFGGLEVACWPLVPKFAGSNPAEAVGFFRAKNPQHAFLRKGSKALCPVS